MKSAKIIMVALITLILLTAFAVPAFAADATEATAEQSVQAVDNSVSAKAIAAGLAIGLAAAAGAIGMAFAIAKCSESMARQPELADKINSAMMLGLVFIETAIIYALIVAIIIIFVL